ncbi:MAG: NUDIX hydrolase [Candidatus Niyogibacteria bacterium]|nr:NUDIX hydrolase [Candidatus Niyogibacteria bacterium]
MTRPVLYDGFLKVVRAENGFEVVEVTDSVTILPYDEATDSVVLISEVRPAMISPNNPTGEMLSIPAGRFDGNYGVRELMVKELAEEAGISVSESQIELLNGGKPLALSPGICTEKTYLGFVSVAPGQIERTERIFGNVHEGERIRRQFVPVSALPKMVFGNVTTFALFQWFWHNQASAKWRCPIGD